MFIFYLDNSDQFVFLGYCWKSNRPTDASIAVYLDCTSHTGACLILVNGSVLFISTKQKINNKCLTGSELIGVDEAVTSITGTKNFFKSQIRSTNINSSLKPLGYDASIKQENVGVIQLEKNRRELSSNRMKHINIQYFFINDRLNLGISAKLSTSQL